MHMVQDLLQFRQFFSIVGIMANEDFDGLVQERRNSIADALELCLSCTNPSSWWCKDSGIGPILWVNRNDHIDGLMQDCSISIANALEILQSCTKPSTYSGDPS